MLDGEGYDQELRELIEFVEQAMTKLQLQSCQFKTFFFCCCFILIAN